MNKERVKTSIIKMNFYVLKYVFKFCPLFIVFALFNVAACVTESLIEVELINKAVDALLNNSGDAALYRYIITNSIILAVCLVFKTLYNKYISEKYSYIYRKKMQTFLFSKVKRIDMASYDDPEFYDKFVRGIEDSTWRGMNVFNNFIDFIKTVSISLALGAYVISIDIALVAIILVSAVAHVITVNVINKLWYNNWRDGQPARRYGWYVRRTFYQQRFAAEIKTTPVGDLLIQKFENKTDELEHIYRRTEKKTILPYSIQQFFSSIVQNAGSYLYLAYKLTNGLTISLFTSTIAAVSKFSSNFINAISIYTNLRENSYYISDFIWITSYEPEVEKDEGIKDIGEFKDLEVKNICFAYPKNNHNSIEDLSISLKQGEKIAIVGDNGGGKTTLTKLLLKFYNPSVGEIYFNGKDLREYNEKALREQYAIVYQDFQIYAVTIAENVLMRRLKGKEDEERVREALRKVGLLEKIESFEKGIYTQVTREFDRDGATFSGGERQRLVISRVFASDANIYILDEPTSALDPLSEERINKLIIQNASNKAMIIIAHRLSTVVDADKIYLIRKGKIYESGTHEELMALKGHYYEMFTTQTELYIKNK